MGLFLKILGSLLLIIVALIAGIYLFVRIKLGKFAGLDANRDLTPLIIHLNEDVLPDWTEKGEAIAFEEQLVTLGFVPGKSYQVVEMDGMKLKAYFQPPYIAVLYSHPIAGFWVDLGAEVIDSYSYTVTNAPMGSEIETPPWTIKYYMENQDLTALFTRLQDIVDEKPCVEVTSGNFRDFFEKVYKKEMKWKNKQGGISFEEFLKTAGNMPGKFTEQQLQEAFRDIKRKELLKWHDGALEEYINVNGLPQEEFEELRYNKFIVPVKTHPFAFLDYLESQGVISHGSVEKFETAYRDEDDIPTLFNRINATFSGELRAVKVGNVDYPIAIDIYSLGSVEG